MTCGGRTCSVCVCGGGGHPRVPRLMQREGVQGMSYYVVNLGHEILVLKAIQASWVVEEAAPRRLTEHDTLRAGVVFIGPIATSLLAAGYKNNTGSNAVVVQVRPC